MECKENDVNDADIDDRFPADIEKAAFGALFQIPQYYRKFLYYKTKMLCNYVINI
jgi:hypothetical protein